LHELGSCFTETFPVRSQGGSTVHVTLRLCPRCGRRFPDRTQLREYLRSRLPSWILQGTLAVTRS